MFKKQILVTLLLACFLLWTNSGYSQTKPDRKSLLVERTDSQKWALLIGVDDYSNINDLEFCGADQRALYSQLINNGFKKENIFLLHDGAKDNKYLPFKNNIEKQLKTILKIVEHEDVLLVAFSGHGVNLDGNTYFCPTDADLERVATLLPIQFVYEQLRGCKAALKFLMIDACRNDPRPRGARTPVNPTLNFAKSLNATKPPLGVIVFSSCTLGETSHENESLKHGVFMHYVLEAIDGKADQNRNGKVSLSELTGYAGRNTKLFVARTYNDVQRPFINGELTTEVLDYDLFTVSKPSVLMAPSGVRKAEHQKTSQNNLQRIALALHEFHAKHGMFPALYSTDASGKPLLSWRVHLLPYLANADLYRRFRLDEPWNSEHNRALMREMPAVFRSPETAGDRFVTNYLAIESESSILVPPSKSMFGLTTPLGISMKQVTDGTSNTIAILEVSDNRACEWTRPQDFRVVADNPLEGLGHSRDPKVFLTTFVDASAKVLSRDLDRKMFLGLTTRNGGESVYSP
ncbi:MAG: caspase family protein [Planctomycetaceae bacterium]|nr:caspase family protein [Planctomycetaceae bacterium]